MAIHTRIVKVSIADMAFGAGFNGATLVSDMVADTTSVTVENTGGTATLSAAIGGDGSLAFSDPA